MCLPYFVVFCESREDAEQVIVILTAWLKERGLTLSTEKTRIVHLTEGFDFLGFNIRLYKAPQTSRSGYKLLIKPSKESVRKIREKLRQEWLALRGANVQVVLKRLNPIIRGWSNYFRTVVAKRVFNKLDRWMLEREIRYVRHSHPTKSWKWQSKRYWGNLNKTRKDRWVFGDKATGGYLLKFVWFKIERHVLVRGTASPDDPSLRQYWAERTKRKANNLPPKEQGLAKSQKHVCRRCGTSLYNGEELQTHHLEPRSKGGDDAQENTTLIHLYCHQQIHSGKGSTADADGNALLL